MLGYKYKYSQPVIMYYSDLTIDKILHFLSKYY